MNFSKPIEMKNNNLKNVLILLGLCIILTSCNKKETSQKAFVDLPYSFKSNDAEKLSEKAFNLSKEKEYDEAINLYQQAIKIEPDNPKLFFDISSCYFNQGNLNEALTALNSAIKLDSLNPSFYSNRGLLYWQLEQDQDAINEYKKAIALDSSNWVAYTNLSTVYYTTDRLVEACEIFQLAQKFGLTSSVIDSDKYLKEISDLCK